VSKPTTSGVEQFDALIATGPKCSTVAGRSFADNRDKIVCLNGTTVSVQASEFHYSSPRDNHGPYTAVECGFPNVAPNAALLEFADDPDKPTKTVYGYVPVAIVREWLAEEDAKAEEVKP
jgi:hypothetical protein